MPAMWAVFLATLSVFALAVWFVPPVRSAADFFHFSGLRQNLASLVAANVTIGTGLAYLLVGGQQNGLSMLLAPAGVVAGYFLLEWFARRVVTPRVSASGNFFAGIKSGIEHARQGERSYFEWLVLLPLVGVFLMLFGYEIFVSSQLIAGLLGSPSLHGELAVAGALFVASLGLCSYGGVRAVFRTDVLQLIGIAAFIVVLGWAGHIHRSSPHLQQARAVEGVSAVVVVAAVAAVSTQIYSLINWFSVSNFETPAGPRRLLRTNALIVALVLAAITAIGATSGIDWSAGLSVSIEAAIASVANGNVALRSVCVIGATCIVLSTSDSLMISLAMFLHDSVMGHDSRDDEQSAEKVGRSRRIVLVMFLVAFSALAAMYYGRPSIFFLLLAIGGGASSFTPLILLVGYLDRRQALAAISPSTTAVFFAFFLGATASGIAASDLAPSLVPFISLAFFSASAVSAVLIAYRATRGP